MFVIGKPAKIRGREIMAAIKAARKEGVKEVVVTIGDEAAVVIPLGDQQADDKGKAADKNEWLEDLGGDENK
jgi:hypothetical protein